MILGSKHDMGWHLSNQAYATNNGYPSRVNTTVKPTGDGVISLGEEGIFTPTNLLLLPIGQGAATNTFSLQVLGWAKTWLNVGTPLWIPVKLGEWAVTLGTGAGLAGSDLPTTTLFATTITSTYGPTFVTSGQVPFSASSWFELSPGSNVQGVICCPTLGFTLAEVIFTTGGSATGCNSLYRKL